MSHQNQHAFKNVFKDAFTKCFGTALIKPLSEIEARQFSNAIFDATGLVIGAKSLKNYSAFILASEDARHENPSAATLDTLARYVLNAPYTTEPDRKEKESHYPYWFAYKAQQDTPAIEKPQQDLPTEKEPPVYKKFSLSWPLVFMLLVVASIVAFVFFRKQKHDILFTDNFSNLTSDSLAARGWTVLGQDDKWWSKRKEQRPGLTLFTLRGDNWPDTGNVLGIKNLLVRKLATDCFSAEMHLENFVPYANWQQAGILLMEDTSFAGRCIRISIGYNDYFGGYERPKEVIIQGVASGGGEAAMPEEIAHIPLFTMQQGNDSLVKNNLRYSALRIEKQHDQFRFLYSASPVANFAFKEAFTKQVAIKPNYVGIFALQGFVNNTDYMPVHISYFSLSGHDCE